ncbi:permease prefix domain 1-containing protein [Antribacter gilvus]|uniref:permease prefix domain 1-containing protein n=1 Tax=Antribacter gilvus TaxID=2304675 RepID=UPI000F789FF8|nr:permease prefix domain 1-containing protein [Antribacter gilvus]
MTTLTDRYLWAAARSVPAQQRDEIRRELAERIGDDVDARVEAGATPAEAERQALTALGDPGAVAATYLDRPLHLVGPRYYLVWQRLLKVLLASVLPAVAVGLPLVQSLAGEPFGHIVGSTAVTLITVAIHLVFWTTLVFVLVERNTGDEALVEWTPDLLPAGAEKESSLRVDLIASAVLVVATGLAILLHERFLPYRDATGDVVPVFDPTSWTSLRWFLLAVLAVELVVLGLLLRRGRWTWGFAAAYSLLSVAFVVPFVALLVEGRLFYEPFLEHAGWDGLAPLLDAGGAVALFLAVLMVAGGAVAVVDAVLKAHRADRTT